MLMVLQPLLLLLTLAVGMTLTGRAASALLGVRWLRRRSVENYLVAAFAGTALWVLFFGWCAHLGLNSLQAAPVVFGGAGLLLVLAVWQRPSWLLPPRFRWPTVLVGSLCLLGACLALLPAFAGSWCNPFNDTFTYASIGKWLRDHPFSEFCPLDAEHPLTWLVNLFQRGHYRMGATFLLALTGELFPAYDLLELFPVVSAWGLVLNLGGIYLLARWSLRLPRLFAAAAMGFAALSYSLMFWSFHAGFQPQLFGTASLAVLVAVLSRCLSPCCWRPREAILVGLLSAALASVYSELLSVLALVGLYCLAVSVRRARAGRRLGRLAGFLGVLVVSAVALGNIEWQRAFTCIRLQMQEELGFYFPWSRKDFSAVALGVASWTGPTIEWNRYIKVGTLVATLCLLVGLWRARRTHRSGVFVTAILVFGLVGGYFHFFVRDRVSGQYGHFWSVLKICKWAFPLTVTVMAVGLWRLVRRVPLHGLSLVAGGAVCVCCYLPIHAWNAHATTEGMQAIADSEQPVEAWRHMCHRIDELGMEKLYLVHEPKGQFPRCLIAYLVHPRPMVNGWLNSNLLDAVAKNDVVTEVGPKVLPLMWGQPPFEEPKEKLPGGVSILDRDHPILFRLENATCLDAKTSGKRQACFGAKPMTFYVWSAQARPALLTWEMSPGPGAQGTGKRQLQLRQPDGMITKLASTAEHTTIAVQVRVPAGVSAFEVSCTDADTVTRTAAQDALADRLTTLTDVRFTTPVPRETAAEPSTAATQ